MPARYEARPMHMHTPMRAENRNTCSAAYMCCLPLGHTPINGCRPDLARRVAGRARFTTTDRGSWLQALMKDVELSKKRNSSSSTATKRTPSGEGRSSKEWERANGGGSIDDSARSMRSFDGKPWFLRFKPLMAGCAASRRQKH
jgi:hypothetical protein